MSDQLHGWMGRVLRVDLDRRRGEVLPLPEAVRREYLGGRGLAGYFLRHSAVSACYALPCDDPDLPLVIAAGPLTGTEAPASSRCHIASRSPMTKAFGDASLGGRLGIELKHAGYDALVVTGRANRLSGIEIDDGAVRVTDATALSGLPVPDAFARLREARPSGAIACTGPAAENGCRFASIMADAYHSAARCGLGLVAGMRNLKYVAVRGTGSVPVADPAGLKSACEDILRLANASPALMGAHGFAKYGTASMFDLMDSRRMMPTDNFRRTHFEHAGALGAHAFATRYHPVRRGSPTCPVQCKAIAGDGRPMPEYEALCGFSALIGNAMPELVMRANDFCACLGLDPVSAASVLACHRELSGCEYEPDQVLALLLGMATGTGPEARLGRELGQGAMRYADDQDRPELAMHVKGLDLPPYDPRGGYGLALAYAVSTQGGSHLRANPLSHEVLRKPVATDRFSFSGKARMVRNAEDAMAAAESLTVCRHMLLAAGIEEYAKAYAAVTGLSPQDGGGAADLLLAGERICYQERMLNTHNGMTAADDDLPERFFAEAGSGTPEIPVPPVPRAEFLAARAAYYQVRGLDENGLPRRETAERLHLPWPLNAHGAALEEPGEGQGKAQGKGRWRG